MLATAFFNMENPGYRMMPNDPVVNKYKKQAKVAMDTMNKYKGYKFV